MKIINEGNEEGLNKNLISCIIDQKLSPVMSDLLKHIESAEFTSFLLKIRKNCEILQITLIDYNTKIDEFILVNNKLLNNKL